MKKTSMTAIIAALIVLLVVGVFRGEAKPSVPEFTLKVVEYPYDVAPTTTADPYTGKTVTTQADYHVENKSIEITIINQPFSPYDDANDKRISLYYNVTVKGHYEDNWDYCFNNPYRGLLNASDSDYTIISMPFGHHLVVPLGGYPLENVDVGDEVDFQVRAQIGYYDKIYTGMFAPVPSGDFYYVFTGETSDWSDTQTVTINASTSAASPETSASPSPSSSPSPITTPLPFATQQSKPEPPEAGILPYVFVAVAAVIIGFVAAVLVALLRNKPKAKQSDIKNWLRK